MDDIEIKFCWTDQEPADILEHSNYQTAEEIHSCHPPCTNEMNKIPPLQQLELVSISDGAVCERGLIVQLEHKTVRWMMDFVPKRSGSENVVVDLCSKTMAKACLHSSEHQYLVRCKMDEGGVEEALPGLVEFYV